jgi:hypothetical protein
MSSSTTTTTNNNNNDDANNDKLNVFKISEEYQRIKNVKGIVKSIHNDDDDDNNDSEFNPNLSKLIENEEISKLRIIGSFLGN